MTQKRMLTFRLRNIPLTYDEEKLKTTFWQEFTPDERMNILPIFSLVPAL